MNSMGLFFYLCLLVLAEIAASVLVACKTKSPGQIVTTALVCFALLAALERVVEMTFFNTWATTLPLFVLGIGSLVVIIQLFRAKPQQRED